ncbi:hypothetical protein JCM10556A_24590 [Bacteroides acidifaciens]
MYYAYVYKKSASEIYGLCIVCGEICLNLKWLYEFLQSTLEALANRGILFCYDESGKIRKNIDSFSSEAAEVDSVFREMQENVNGRQSYWGNLPPEDFSVSMDSKISLAFNEDDKNKITAAIRHYHNVIVTMDNVIPSSFSRTVERLNSEKGQLQEEKEALKKEIESLSQQKKQYRWVFILFIAVIVSLVGLYSLNNSISDMNTCIAQLQDTLSNKRDSIRQQNIQIQELSADIVSCRDSLRTFESKFLSVKDIFPIHITNIEIGNIYHNGEIETDYGNMIYSSHTMYLQPKITYVGINTGCSVDLKIKWYMPNGLIKTGNSSPSGYSQQESLYVYSGSNSKILSGWGNTTKGHWIKGEYRIEIWYENVCLNSKAFTIY